MEYIVYIAKNPYGGFYKSLMFIPLGVKLDTFLLGKAEMVSIQKKTLLMRFKGIANEENVFAVLLPNTLEYYDQVNKKIYLPYINAKRNLQNSIKMFNVLMMKKDL